ncbi:MAG: RDD family protein [Bacteroidetes bacterium]|nr:RDD family protein [Bacteroidota bacterium]
MEDQLLDSIDDQGFKNVSYAGFWERFVAALIDGLILFVVTFALGLVIQKYYVWFETSCYSDLYFTYFESSLKQATIGKQLMNMKVVDKNGGRLTPAVTALIRIYRN